MSFAPLSIEVAVATMEQDDPLALTRRLGLEDGGVAVTIINQVAGSAPGPFERGTIRMFSYAERGLSRSRNRALSQSRGDILLLADDDIEYLPDFAQRVRAAFSSAREAAAITFQMQDSRGRPTKRYARRAFRHHLLSVPRVSSVEVALRPDRLRGQRFDERFGLGAAYPSGEEAIFLADALRQGLAVHYAPSPICTHDGPTSGQRLWDQAMLRAKGALLRRLYPYGWPLALSAFGLLKLQQRPEGMTLASWSTGLWSGARGLRND